MEPVPANYWIGSVIFVTFKNCGLRLCRAVTTSKRSKFCLVGGWSDGHSGGSGDIFDSAKTMPFSPRDPRTSSTSQ